VVRWRWVVACACLVIAINSLGGVAVAARPSQETPTPEGDWVHSVCGALVNWRGEVEHAAADATNATRKARKLSASAKAKKAKQAMGEFLGVALDATTTAQENLRAIGGPPVTNNADVDDALLASFDQLTSFFQSSRDQTQAVSTKNAKRAERKLSSIAAAVTTQSNEVHSLMNNAIAKDVSGELSGAIEADPQCVDVVGGEG
jgi:hypothetical protein